jgi:hypothetical protein
MATLDPCDLCGAPAEVWDHDHQTGQIRGRLCKRCNLWLSPLEPENLEWKAKAEVYLSDPPRSGDYALLRKDLDRARDRRPYREAHRDQTRSYDRARRQRKRSADRAGYNADMREYRKRRRVAS